jgi:GNAT superfamily N-acetyltransferase
MPENSAVEIHHVAWTDPRAVALREVMDAEMQVRYGLDDPADAELTAAIHRALAVDEATVMDTVLLVDDGVAVAHAGLRMLETDSGSEWEIKRVIVDGTRRGRGLGRTLMAEVARVASSCSRVTASPRPSVCTPASASHRFRSMPPTSRRCRNRCASS